jgi:hypothetical protein
MLKRLARCRDFRAFPADLGTERRRVPIYRRTPVHDRPEQRLAVLARDAPVVPDDVERLGLGSPPSRPAEREHVDRQAAAPREVLVERRVEEPLVRLVAEPAFERKPRSIDDEDGETVTAMGLAFARLRERTADHVVEDQLGQVAPDAGSAVTAGPRLELHERGDLLEFEPQRDVELVSAILDQDVARAPFEFVDSAVEERLEHSPTLLEGVEVAREPLRVQRP